MIKKWVISGSYNPNVGLIQNHTVNLSKNLNFYLSKYENFIVIGDFNAEITIRKNLCVLQFLIKQPTCFKNLENLTGINHIMANHPKKFHSSSIFKTGLSDFHKLTLTVLKVQYGGFQSL